MVPVYSAVLLFSLHFFLLMFINSSYLLQYWDTEQVGILYLIGSIITVALFLFTPAILQKIPLYPLLLAFLGFETLGTLTMAFGYNPFLVGFGFVLIQLAAPILYFVLDVYLQKLITDTNTVGDVRSIFMTLSAVTVVIAPTIAAALISTYSYSSVYIVSIFFLLPLFFISSRYFSKVPNSSSVGLSIPKTVSKYIFKGDLRRVFEANIILKIYYAAMTIYLPLYLTEKFGLGWDTIGIIITVMLVPFILFQIPYGNIADKYLGEKELMVFGFILTGVATILFTLSNNPSIYMIAGLLFTTRIGASAVDTMTETYFFKKVSSDSTDLISFFRITTPLSFIITPIIAGIILLHYSYGAVFFSLGIISFLGIIPALLIHDTK